MNLKSNCKPQFNPIIKGLVALLSVPCEPQNVSTELDCQNNTALVSWELSERVFLHQVTALGSDGHSISCSSSSDSCTLPSMHCGQNYNLTVTAVDDVCNSSQSRLTVHSGGCHQRHCDNIGFYNGKDSVLILIGLNLSWGHCKYSIYHCCDNFQYYYIF